jgi:hypothetical protein
VFSGVDTSIIRWSAHIIAINLFCWDHEGFVLVESVDIFNVSTFKLIA